MNKNHLKKKKTTAIAIIKQNDQLWTTSLDIAEKFGKRHKNVLQSIENLECSEEFKRLNFRPSSYLNQQKKEQPMYLISKKGFSLLAMGFTGKKATEWKEKYIDAFNQMEKAVFRLARQAQRKGGLAYQKARPG